MSPESPKTKKKPELVANPQGGAAPDENAPERVRKPHYDWEHETQAELERPRRVKSAARVWLWKDSVEAWIRRYLLLADRSFGGRDDDFDAA